jgi:hypothetical protein
MISLGSFAAAAISSVARDSGRLEAKLETPTIVNVTRTTVIAALRAPRESPNATKTISP